jgi:hypothetical protein
VYYLIIVENGVGFARIQTAEGRRITYAQNSDSKLANLGIVGMEPERALDAAHL